MKLDIRFEKIIPQNNSYRFYSFVPLPNADDGFAFRILKGRKGHQPTEVDYRFGSLDAMYDEIIARARDRYNHGYILVSLAGPAELCEHLNSLGACHAAREEKEGRSYRRLLRFKDAFPEIEEDERLRDALDILLARHDPKPNMASTARSGSRGSTADQLALPFDTPDPANLLADSAEDAAILLTSHVVKLLLQDFPRRHRAVRSALFNATRTRPGENVVELRRSQSGEGALTKSLFNLFADSEDLLEIGHILAERGIRTLGQLIRLDINQFQKMTSVTPDQLRRIDNLCGQFGQYQLGMTALKVV